MPLHLGMHPDQPADLLISLYYYAVIEGDSREGALPDSKLLIVLNSEVRLDLISGETELKSPCEAGFCDGIPYELVTDFDVRKHE